MSRRDATPWVFPLIYIAAAWLIYRPLGLFDGHRIATGPHGDLISELWFLSYWEHAVAHLHLAPWTDLFDYPQGINLLHTASFPLLGILAAPLTAAVGPVAALAFLFRLALVLSSLAAMLVFRKLVRSPLAAGIGGLAYGFSPYMLTQAPIHIFLVFVPLPPVILYQLYRALSTSTDSDTQRRAGAIAGALTVVQFLICSELAITTLLMAVLTAVVLALFRGRERARDRRDLTRALQTVRGFVTVAIVPLALLAWLTLRGRGVELGGPPGGPLGLPGIDPWATVAPNAHDLMGVIFGSPPIGWTRSRADSGFLGPVLILVAGWIAVRQRANPVVRAGAVLAVLAWLLALGAYLSAPGGGQTTIPVLWNVLARIPLIQQAEANRLTLYLDLGVAVLLVVGIDALSAGRAATAPRARRAAPAVLIAIGIALAAPATPIHSAAITGPARAFQSARLTDLIPPGSVVAALPPTLKEERPPMLWQALARMRFKLLSGRAVMQATSSDGHLNARRLRGWQVAAIIAPDTAYDRAFAAHLNATYPFHTSLDGVTLWRTADDAAAAAHRGQ